MAELQLPLVKPDPLSAIEQMSLDSSWRCIQQYHPALSRVMARIHRIQRRSFCVGQALSIESGDIHRLHSPQMIQSFFAHRFVRIE
jgi:hypothetical protein